MMNKFNVKLICQQLLKAEHINLLTSNNIIERGSISKLNPLVVIANSGSTMASGLELTMPRLVLSISNMMNMPMVTIDPLKLEYGAIAKVISRQYAERLQILPIEVKGKNVKIATSNPYDLAWVLDLEKATSYKIEVVIANPIDIESNIPKVFSLAQSMNSAVKSGSYDTVGIQNFEQLVELGNKNNLDANEQHVVNIVDWLLTYAFEHKASDIHFEPRREEGAIRLRIDGVLHQVYRIPSAVMVAVLSRMKLLARMDLTEKRRPQDGRIKTTSPYGEVELRISTVPTTFGEKMVARIFDPETVLKEFVDLGFDEKDVKIWKGWVTQPNGVIMVTGPTGSGKTTTLYSTLKSLSTDEVNVSTIEDPIEMVENSFNQIQVNSNVGLNFAEGVRALMRQDPDIIMVGEIRDLETAEMATQASLTGHLVLSTIHTNDASATITRLMDLGIPPYLISTTLLGVLAQRLLRKLCPKCKVQHELTDAEWGQLTAPWKVSKPQIIYKPLGCIECRNTGYKGRIGIYEMMTVTQEIKALIVKDVKNDDIKMVAYKNGMTSLRYAGMMKVYKGITSIEEVLKTTPSSLGL